MKLLLNHYQSRLAEIRESLRKRKVDGFLITDITNVRYLTGFTGSSGFLLLAKRECFFVTDFRYKEQSEKEIKGWDLVIEKGDRVERIRDLCKKTGLRRIGFEPSVSYEFYRRLSKQKLRLTGIGGLVERCREIKDSTEISLIREATRRAETAFLEIKPYIRNGAREHAIALRLEEKLRKAGCERIPFDPIVASGPNSAMPHAKPTGRKLQKGDLVIIDWGGEAGGYFSDMTRTLLLQGEPVNKQREIYRLVLEANRKAISRVAPGVNTGDIDSVARNVIRKAGYGNFFGHGTGHGVGLQVHESPRITWTENEKIRKHMVFTIEPGVYIPGLGGVRIEDMVVAGGEKAHVLTSLPKTLEIV